MPGQPGRVRQDLVEAVGQHQDPGRRGLGAGGRQVRDRRQTGAHRLQQGLIGIRCGVRLRHLIHWGGRQRRPVRQCLPQALKEGAEAVARIARAKAVVIDPLPRGGGVAEVPGQPGHEEGLADPGAAEQQAQPGDPGLAAVAPPKPVSEHVQFRGAADQVLLEDAGLAQEVVPAEGRARARAGGGGAVQAEQGAEGFQVEGQGNRLVAAERDVGEVILAGPVVELDGGGPGTLFQLAGRPDQAHRAKAGQRQQGGDAVRRHQPGTVGAVAQRGGSVEGGGSRSGQAQGLAGGQGEHLDAGAGPGDAPHQVVEAGFMALEQVAGGRGAQPGPVGQGVAQDKEGVFLGAAVARATEPGGHGDAVEVEDPGGGQGAGRPGRAQGLQDAQPVPEGRALDMLAQARGHPGRQDLPMGLDHLGQGQRGAPAHGDLGAVHQPVQAHPGVGLRQQGGEGGGEVGGECLGGQTRGPDQDRRQRGERPALAAVVTGVFPPVGTEQDFGGTAGGALGGCLGHGSLKWTGFLLDCSYAIDQGNTLPQQLIYGGGGDRVIGPERRKELFSLAHWNGQGPVRAGAAAEFVDESHDDLPKQLMLHVINDSHMVTIVIP